MGVLDRGDPEAPPDELGQLIVLTRNDLSYVGRDGACSLTIAVPDSDESIIDLGKLLCVPE